MESSTYTSAWDIPVKDINGKEYAKLGDLVGDPKPSLTIITNVASRCGLTKNHYT